MQKNLSSWLLRFSLALVPVAIGGCAADGDDAAAPAPASTGDAIEASYQQLESRVAREDLTLKTSHVSPDGATHVRFNQLYQGVSVFEGEVITHVAGNGTVTETNALRPIRNLNVTPNISKDNAIAFARDAGPADGSVQVLDAKLMVLPNGEHDSRDRLTWYVRLFSEGGADGAAQWDTFIDAHNGKLALAFDTLETGAAARGHTAWSGDVVVQAQLAGSTYSLTDDLGNTTVDMANKTTGNPTAPVTSTTTTVFDGITVGLFGNYVNGITGDSKLTAAADAHFGMGKTLEYYQSVLGRTGIDGLGTPTKSRVHYGSLYENAFWQDSCYCMTYGDGGSTLNTLTSLDVAGHELSHGVMSKEAALTYRGESGGLNESNSDIFGTMVEFYANSASDTPDWTIGERLFKSSATKALRYMDKPSTDGRSPNCWSKQLKSLDVHYSSGPNNHMFFLLAQGEDVTLDNPTPTAPTTTSQCNGKPVRGIGRAKAAKIWYTAVSNYMTASATYASARAAAITAAQSLASEGVTADDVQSVRDAFTAINVP